MEKQITLKIDGMHCAHCVKRIETALKNFKEIKKISVDLESGKAALSLRKDLSEQAIIDAICALGFKAERI